MTKSSANHNFVESVWTLVHLRLDATANAATAHLWCVAASALRTCLAVSISRDASPKVLLQRLNQLISYNPPPKIIATDYDAGFIGDEARDWIRRHNIVHQLSAKLDCYSDCARYARWMPKEFLRIAATGNLAEANCAAEVWRQAHPHLLGAPHSSCESINSRVARVNKHPEQRFVCDRGDPRIIAPRFPASSSKVSLSRATKPPFKNVIEKCFGSITIPSETIKLQVPPSATSKMVASASSLRARAQLDRTSIAAICGRGVTPLATVELLIDQYSSCFIGFRIFCDRGNTSSLGQWPGHRCEPPSSMRKRLVALASGRRARRN